MRFDGTFVIASTLALAFVASSPGAPARADDRPYVWTYDADGPVDEQVEAIYLLSTAAGPSGAVRFLSAGRLGVMQQLGAQAAFTEWLAVGAYGLVSLGNPLDTPVNATAGGYVQLTLLRPSEGEDGGSLQLMVSGVRELPGDHPDVFALSGWINGGYRIGPVNIGGNLQIERRFAPDADPIDLLVRFGVMTDVYRDANACFRLGPEYVGQDLEGYFEDEDEEAEGGPVHLLALSMALRLGQEDVNLGVSPGVVLANGQAGFGGALNASVRFYAW